MNHDISNSIAQKPLTYQPTLAKDIFATVEQDNWSMILRSASDDHIDSRYDILVADPVATIVTKGSSTFITSEGVTTETDNDPFDVIHELQQNLLPNVSQQDGIPFCGGALGYFSYDLGRRVESIPSLAIEDIDLPDMAIGLYSWALIVDHKTKKALIVGDNLDKVSTWLENKRNNYAEKSLSFSLQTDWNSNLTKADYDQKFNQVKEYLLSGDCYQINLTQRFCAGYSGSEWLAYEKLESENKAPFSAFIRLPEGCVLSVSPERFIQLRENIIETKPIKGTRPRYQDPVDDANSANALQVADKDQAENLMIVDLLRNDIGRVAKPGSVHVPKLFSIESFPAVHHLVSTIQAELSDQFSPTDLLKACFPGGSITGAPKVRAMEIIEELEPHRRSIYCGSIGYISRCGQIDTSITIRTLIANQNKLFAWAGGGLVMDSDCDSEYQETFDKLSKILPILTH